MATKQDSFPPRRLREYENESTSRDASRVYRITTFFHVDRKGCRTHQVALADFIESTGSISNEFKIKIPPLDAESMRVPENLKEWVIEVPICAEKRSGFQNANAGKERDKVLDTLWGPISNVLESINGTTGADMEHQDMIKWAFQPGSYVGLRISPVHRLADPKCRTGYVTTRNTSDEVYHRPADILCQRLNQMLPDWNYDSPQCNIEFNCNMNTIYSWFGSEAPRRLDFVDNEVGNIKVIPRSDIDVDIALDSLMWLLETTRKIRDHGKMLLEKSKCDDEVVSSAIERLKHSAKSPSHLKKREWTGSDAMDVLSELSRARHTLLCRANLAITQISFIKKHDELLRMARNLTEEERQDLVGAEIYHLPLEPKFFKACDTTRGARHDIEAHRERARRIANTLSRLRVSQEDFLEQIEKLRELLDLVEFEYMERLNEKKAEQVRSSKAVEEHVRLRKQLHQSLTKARQKRSTFKNFVSQLFCFGARKGSEEDEMGEKEYEASLSSGTTLFGDEKTLLRKM